MQPRQGASALRTRLRTMPERHGRLVLALLCVICALGFGLRANRALHPLPHPGVDATAYFQLSKYLYTDQTWGSPEMHNQNDWSPGAPLLFAGIYFVSGGVHDGAGRMSLALLGLGTIVVAYLLGRRLAGPWAGLLAALGVAVYPSFIHNTGRLLSEPPATFTVPAAALALLWAAERRSPWAWTLPGLLLGLSALIRPEYLPFGLLFGAIVAVKVARDRGWRPGAAAAALLVAAFLLPVVPWTVRNVIALHRFVPISTGGGKALYVGTYLPADGNYFRVKNLLVERYYGEQVTRHKLAQINSVPLFNKVARAHGYPGIPRDTALAKAGRHNFFHYFGSDPLAYVEMLARKSWRIWRSATTKSMQTDLGRIVQRTLVLLAISALVVLAIRRRWEAVVFGVLLLGITAIGAFLLATTRRNEILMPLVIVLAAAALTWLAGYLRGLVVSRPAPASPEPAASPAGATGPAIK